MMSPNPEKKSRKAASCRSAGAVGKNPVVYRHFREVAERIPSLKKKRILDFGAGKNPIHAKKLVEEGFDCHAFDLPENMTEEHLPYAMEEIFDVVLLSNVVNVQTDIIDIGEVLAQAKEVLAPSGHLIVNCPASPRYTEIPNRSLAAYLRWLFVDVEILDGSESGKGAVVFLASIPR